MSEQQTPSMTPIDALICDDDLQEMKACIPFLNPREQPFFLAFAKFMEFRMSLRLISENSDRLQACSMEPAMRTPVHMLNYIRSYCSEAQRHTIDSLLNALQMLQLFQAMQNHPEKEGTSPADPTDYLTSMLSREQQQMFRQFSEAVQNENRSEGNAHGQ